MAKPNTPKPLKGNKSKSWREDLKILERLSNVERLHLAQFSNRKIGRELGFSEATIRRDIKRITELWREYSAQDIEMHRGRSIAYFRRLQRLAHQRYLEGEDIVAMLQVQLRAEDRIIKLQGTIMPHETILQLNQMLEPSFDLRNIPTEYILQRAENLESLAKELLQEVEDESGN